MKPFPLISLICVINLVLMSSTYADSRFVGLWQEITFYDDSGILEDSDNGVSVDDTEYFYISNQHNQLKMQSVGESKFFTVHDIRPFRDTLKFTVINSMEP